MSHPVVFIGAGPGAADLITVRGARRLAEAEVVLFDALTDPGLRELAPRARWVDVGKRGFCHATGQTRINALLVKFATLGLRVVRLKGGDPSVFGRLEEELQALAAEGHTAEVVPGVTAAIAAAAATQRPLTRRGSGRSVSLTTAMTRTGELQATRTADTEVFYMAGRQLAALSRRLREAGWAPDTPVCVVSRAGCADQLSSDHSVATLMEASVLHTGRPAVVTVGVGARALPGATPTARAGLQAPCRVESPARPPGENPKPLKSSALRRATRSSTQPEPAMTHVVTEACIRCKYTDCVDVCPVDCFREGPNFLVIDPDECIDCAVCIPECPVNAILPEEDVPGDQQKFIAINVELSKNWPSITKRKAPLPDADDWKDRTDKLGELIR